MTLRPAAKRPVVAQAEDQGHILLPLVTHEKLSTARDVPSSSGDVSEGDDYARRECKRETCILRDPLPRTVQLEQRHHLIGGKHGHGRIPHDRLPLACLIGVAGNGVLGLGVGLDLHHSLPDRPIEGEERRHFPLLAGAHLLGSARQRTLEAEREDHPSTFGTVEELELCPPPEVAEPRLADSVFGVQKQNWLLELEPEPVRERVLEHDDVCVCVPHVRLMGKQGSKIRPNLPVHERVLGDERIDECTDWRLVHEARGGVRSAPWPTGGKGIQKRTCRGCTGFLGDEVVSGAGCRRKQQGGCETDRYSHGALSDRSDDGQAPVRNERRRRPSVALAAPTW